MNPKPRRCFTWSIFLLCTTLIVHVSAQPAVAEVTSAPAGRALPAAGKTTFTDVSVTAGVFEDNLGWGAAWGDYDGDGNIDIFTVGHLGSICQLWHNNGDGTFTDVTTAAGMLMADGDAHGPCWADLDNDGDLDLYVGKGTNKKDKPINYNDLYRNNGDGTFTNIAVDQGVTGIGCPNRGVTAIDYDNDGDLDLFIPSYFVHDMLLGNILFRNDGDFDFTNVANEAGVSEGFRERGAAWADYNLDGNIDFFISETNALYRNNGDGTFLNVIRQANIVQGLSNGAAWGDYDNDGFPDLYVFGDSGAFLYHNNGNRTFTDVTLTSGTANAPRALGADWGDYDNDGDLDLYVTNYSKPHRLFRNNGDGTFTDSAKGAGVAVDDFGMGSDGTFIDYNNDGFLDLFICNGGGPEPGPYLLFQNDGNENHWLKIVLVGTQSNPGGVGARIALTAGTITAYRQYFGQHAMAQNHIPVHFGLGAESTVTSIVVNWPDGTSQEVDGVAADQTITITEP
jgi:hypothetical protein